MVQRIRGGLALSSAVSVALLVAPALAQQFPVFDAETVAGRKVTMPAAASGHPAVLVIGFAHKSNSETKAWTDRLHRDFPDAHVYSVAVIEDAPRFVRGMIVHGIKGSAPANEYDHYLVVTHHEKELKDAVGFSQPEAAYVVVLNPSGAIEWHFQGAVTDAAVAELRSKLKG